MLLPMNTFVRDSENFEAWLNSNLFSDKTTLTRIFCLLDLCGGIDPKSGDFTEDALVKVLLEDIDPIVRHEAAFALYKLYNMGQIIGMRAMDALCDAACNDISTVARHEAAESLGFFDFPKPIQTLQTLLNDPNPDVVATAKISLERLS